MHLVLGATGGFGGAMVRALLAHGQQVRALVRDPSRARLPTGVEVVHGDVLDFAKLTEAAKGCKSVTHGVNVPYAQWQPTLLNATDNAIEAAAQAGATLVFPGNIYVFKSIYEVPLPPLSGTLDVNDPPNKKGRLRVQIEEQLEQNVEMRGARTLVVRTVEYYGPGVDNGLVGPMFRNALAGKPVPWFVNGKAGHVFTYIDDVAQVATRLLLRDDRPLWDVVNVAGDCVTATDWAHALAKAAGQPPAGVRMMPRWQVRLAGLFDADAREFAELLHQWEAPILLDDSATRAALPKWSPTPMDRALAETMAWYRR